MMRLNQFAAVFFDMDGTLYREDHVLPGVGELLAYLHEQRVPASFVTNNSANTGEELAERLAARGVRVPADEIYTACDAMMAWIEEKSAALGRPARVFNFAGRTLAQQLGSRGTFVASLQDGLTHGCDVLAVGTHFRENQAGFDLERAIDGLNLLMRGAEMVVGSNDRCFPIEGGRLEFGSGSWGRLFAYAASLPEGRAHYVGKPDRAFFRPLCQRLRVDPKHCLIIGDNLESDIQGGLQAGMKTALVLTGVSKREDVARTGIRPDGIYQDLRSLLEETRPPASPS